MSNKHSVDALEYVFESNDEPVVLKSDTEILQTQFDKQQENLTKIIINGKLDLRSSNRWVAPATTHLQKERWKAAYDPRVNPGGHCDCPVCSSIREGNAIQAGLDQTFKDMARKCNIPIDDEYYECRLSLCSEQASYKNGLCGRHFRIDFDMKVRCTNEDGFMEPESKIQDVPEIKSYGTLTFYCDNDE